jgi:hypothetical protein
VTNANDIAALVKDLQGEDAHDVDLITVADALASQARRIAELEGALRELRNYSPDWTTPCKVIDAALSSGKGS